MRPALRGACALLLMAICLSGPTAKADDIPSERGWSILQVNADEKGADKRVLATRALALLPGSPRALRMAIKAASDNKAEVRAAAATTLGELAPVKEATTLRKLLEDKEPAVALAAASALVRTKDPQGYETYYEFLTGERKATDGVIASQLKVIHDPKKLAQIGFENGIGFVPYAGIGYEAFKTLHVDDTSPIRAAAAKTLANDPDPQSGEALAHAAYDKSWIVRVAALEAVAKRGDPALLDEIVPAMSDENTAARVTAAAAVIRLSEVQDARSRKAKP